MMKFIKVTFVCATAALVTTAAIGILFSLLPVLFG